MQHLRIVMYPSDATGQDVIKHWNETVGAYLDDLEGLKTAIVADNGDHLVVVTRWESEAAIEAGLGSEAYQETLAAMLERTGMSADDLEPSMLYVGPIVAHTRVG
jgi:heme-degrading monooxygenase HmoA